MADLSLIADILDWREWSIAGCAALAFALPACALAGWLWSIRPRPAPDAFSVDLNRVVRRAQHARDLADMRARGEPMWTPDPRRLRTFAS